MRRALLIRGLLVALAVPGVLPATAQYEAALVADLYPGASLNPGLHPSSGPMPHNAHPDDLTVYDGQLYFAANDEQGRGLWRYDGTGAPTRVPGLGGDALGNLVVLGERLYFRANSLNGSGWEVWSYNAATDEAAPAGIRARDGRFPDGVVYPQDLVVYDDRIFFNAIGGGVGHELWAYDPATGTLALAADVMPGDPFSHANPAEFAVYDGRLFFSAEDGTHGRELWVYDAATGEATLVADIMPRPEGETEGRYDSAPTDLTVYDGRLFFAADDGAHGRELWVYDAATDETTLAADVDPARHGRSEPSDLTVYDGRLFFAASTGRNDRELWAYDAATNEATRIVDIKTAEGPRLENGSSPSDFAVYDGQLFFAAKGDPEESWMPDLDRELWAYDAATGEARRVADIHAGPYGSGPSHLQVYAGRLFFRADDGVHGHEMWSLTPTRATD